MAKQTPPIDEKALKISTQRIERAWEELRKHSLIGPLVTRAKLRIIDYQPQIPAMFSTVSSAGDIYANPFNMPRTVAEWTFVLAHGLLHLAFGHVRNARRGIAWNLACDCVVNEFMGRMRIGTQPEGLVRLPPGMPNDEEKLFAIWSRNNTTPSGFTTNGSAMDMVAGASGKANWSDIFARAIRKAARESLSAAAGGDAELGQAPQARAWFVKNYPLLGAVLQHFKIVEDAKLCERMGVRIAAVNPGRRELIINPGWAMSDAEVRYVLAHMALHAGLQHAQRRKYREAFAWNAACDYCINVWLSRLPLLQRMSKAPGEGCLLSVVHAGKRPEEIYEELIQDPKSTLKLITFAGEGVADVLGGSGEAPTKGGKGAAQAAAEADAPPPKDRLLLDALLRGYQLHAEWGKDPLPHTLIDEIRSLEHPPLPWDVLLARWFDENVPPIERVRTYGRPSRRQSSTPDIARPRYVWPDEEVAQRGTFGLVIDASGPLDKRMLAAALGAISSYSLSRNIQRIHFVASGSEVIEHHATAEEITQFANLASGESRSGTLQPGVAALEKSRDFPGDAPILIISGTPCDRVQCQREHAWLLREGSRLPFKTSALIIEVDSDF